VTGALSVSTGPAEVAVLVDEARNRFQSGRGRNNLRMDIAPELPQVLADRRRIVQVLGNLLSNAARHSPESSAIRLSVVRDRTHAAFSVADDGAGFSAEFLPQLFRKFSRLGGANRDDGLAGSGLGLAICRGIVEAHGGRIWAESDGPGQGASFTFTLPAVDGGEHAGPSVLPDAGALPRPAGRNRPRVLAVDDDPQTLRYLRNALSDAGFAPTVTGDPRQLGRLLDDTRPHLVLLDLVLPGADGIELLESVPGLAGVPVIFLSAYGRDQTIARALEAGAVDYIVKPFSPTELAARIRTALRQREAPEPAEPSGPYRSGELTIDYAEQTVFLADRPVPLTSTEYRLLSELSVNAGRVLGNEHLLQRVWGQGHAGHSGPVRTAVKNLRHKLGDDADSPNYIFNRPRVGYWMPEPSGQGGLPS
jgi:DNA-binding response OmpR family regulator